MAGVSLKREGWHRPTLLEESYEIMKAANTANPTDEDKKALQKLFDDKPGIWQSIADLSNNLQESIFKHLSSNYLTQESYRKKLAAMRDNLGWKTSNEIERILIEQVCLTWLRHNFIEQVHYEKFRQSHTLELGIHWEKLLTGSQKRYLRACESLAKVRKLLSEAELKEQQARNKRGKSALIAQQILENATK